jgi:hypothetical protein
VVYRRRIAKQTLGWKLSARPSVTAGRGARSGLPRLFRPRWRSLLGASRPPRFASETLGGLVPLRPCASALGNIWAFPEHKPFPYGCSDRSTGYPSEGNMAGNPSTVKPSRRRGNDVSAGRRPRLPSSELRPWPVCRPVRPHPSFLLPLHRAVRLGRYTQQAFMKALGFERATVREPFATMRDDKRRRRRPPTSKCWWAY